MSSDLVSYLDEIRNGDAKGQPVPDGMLNELRDIFPSDLVRAYQKFGCRLFKGGLIQTCLPGEFAGTLAIIFGSDTQFHHKSWHAFAYSCFGTIYIWSKEMGVATVDLLKGSISSRGALGKIKQGTLIENQIFVPFSVSDEALDATDEAGNFLFQRSVKKCGPLEIGECYGFVPALAPGGVADIDHVKRMNAAAHFSIVAQTMNFNLIDVQGYGKSVVVRPIA
ncbi:GAD-like domain-containing protein [Rhizobium oryzicola]|uniref:GAD-like domain-containing protein n=1 Tax=Rhizobium oryzicola TaxID=1232668 RepID=A0ABT8SZJ6_9HYPH|nr:GAD-like domain-containing protein [Rhizobium oryzicola]MDO1583072.1 GAD-like domain-containing protein [Rhizobium oryzicola]